MVFIDYKIVHCCFELDMFSIKVCLFAFLVFFCLCQLACMNSLKLRGEYTYARNFTLEVIAAAELNSKIESRLHIGVEVQTTIK